MRAFIVALFGDHAAPANPPLELVRANHLGPIAYRRGVAELRHEYAASTIMADRRERLLHEVAATFDLPAIRFALIKGAAFIGTIYPDAGERPMHDVDVLVQTTDLPAAVECMQSIGFRRTGFARKQSGYYHATVFIRDDMMFEMHRSIVQKYRTRLHIHELWERAIPDARIPGAERLEPVDELLICALHIARHELAVPAINYLDVHRLHGKLDASARATLWTRARSYRIERSIMAVLSMTEKLATGASGPPEIGRGAPILPTTDDVLRRMHPRRLRQIGQKLLLTEGTRERLGLGFAYGAAILEGWWRERSGAQR